jgi:hypothetical protein
MPINHLCFYMSTCIYLINNNKNILYIKFKHKFQFFNLNKINFNLDSYILFRQLKMGSYNQHIKSDKPQSKRSMYRHKAAIKKREVIFVLFIKKQSVYIFKM